MEEYADKIFSDLFCEENSGKRREDLVGIIRDHLLEIAFEQYQRGQRNVLVRVQDSIKQISQTVK